MRNGGIKVDQQPTPTDLRPESFLDRVTARPALLVGVLVVGLLLVASGALLWLAVGRGAGDQVPVPPEFATAPTLEELALAYPEPANLLNDPALGSVYKDFIVSYEEGGVEAAEQLARTRGLLNDRGEIRITLVVDSQENVPAMVDELQGVGITVEGSYRERINVGVPMALIEQLAEERGTEALFEQLTQMEHIIRLELPVYNRSGAVSGVEGEGVSLVGAEAWHAAGATGQSIHIGVLDLGFDGYRDLLGSELPDNVTAASFVYGKEPDQAGQPHGTACAEVIHDMAPDAELFLAYYDGSLVSEGMAVDWLLEQGVQIISHSAGGVVGPMDGSGEGAELVDEVAEKGILWVNASGNEGVEHYRGSFHDTDSDGLHEFPDGTEFIGVWFYYSEVDLALNWDDWQNATEDYDLFLYDKEGELLASSQNVQNGQAGQEAAEYLLANDMAEGLYYLSIKADDVSRAGTLDLYTVGAEIEFPVSEHSLGSPADARGALAVGATEYRDDSLATYSSQGPSNDGRLKPEISAPTGVSGATYGANGFDGTSASAPHVAGAAALVWSAFPDWSRDQVRDYLLANALDLGLPGPDNAFGYGRLRLPAPGTDLGQLPLPVPQPTIQPMPTLVTERTGGEDVESSVMPVILLGASGLCGTAVVLGAGALLVVALQRRTRPLGAEMPREPAYDEATPPQRGVLVGENLPLTRLRAGRTTIGRSADNDIVLDNPKVSRRHARIEQSDGTCTVEDLGSANGVLVNGRRVPRAVLVHGDRLRLGDVELTYKTVSEPYGVAEAADTGPARAWLEMGGRRYPVLPTGALIGRASTSDVCVADERVSRQHARIAVQSGHFVITDLESSAGTYVNEERVRQRALRDGDEIGVGGSRLRFRAPGEV